MFNKPAYMKQYNAAYREANGGVIAENKSKGFVDFTEWLNNLRMAVGCRDEGPHEGRLEHHHSDPTAKLRDVSQMYGYSREKIDAEIAKCVVLCKSCHRKRHVEMRALAA